MIKYDSFGPVMNEAELACYPIILRSDSKHSADLLADFFATAGLLVVVAASDRGWYTRLDHRARLVR